MKWMTNIKEWAGIRYEDLVKLAQDRAQWTWTVMTARRLEEMAHDDDESAGGCSLNYLPLLYSCVENCSNGTKSQLWLY